MTPAKATSAPARWSHRFAASDIERFIPATGALLLGFDKRQPAGRQLSQIQAFATREEAEAAMLLVDVACLVSLPLPPRQLDLFTASSMTRARKH